MLTAMRGTFMCSSPYELIGAFPHGYPSCKTLLCQPFRELWIYQRI